MKHLIKHTFTAEDIYDRARRTLEQSLLHGVTHMRTQVEVDPNVGLLGFEAIEQLKKARISPAATAVIARRRVEPPPVAHSAMLRPNVARMQRTKTV